MYDVTQHNWQYSKSDIIAAASALYINANKSFNWVSDLSPPLRNLTTSGFVWCHSETNPTALGKFVIAKAIW